MALIEIGVEPIDNLNDENERANIMDKIYDQTVDELIEGYQWNFAMERQLLVQKAITTAQALEFTTAWQLPTNPYCLRATEMINSEDDWKVEGRTLLTNLSAVTIKYIKRITDPVQFTPSFIGALVPLLASKAVLPLKQDAKAKEALFGLHLEMLNKAKANDGQEGTAEDFVSSELTDTRFQTGG
jgi:hypothetical protein